MRIDELLGVGSFGEVFSGTWNKTPVALKKIKSDYYELFKKEADALM